MRRCVICETVNIVTAPTMCPHNRAQKIPSNPMIDENIEKNVINTAFLHSAHPTERFGRPMACRYPEHIGVNAKNEAYRHIIRSA